MDKQTAHLRSCLALLLLFLLSSLSPPNTSAQSVQAGQVTVLFVLDDSGSMASSDPANLRYAAAKLFVASLDEGDVVGAIRFSTTSQPILQGLVSISNPRVKNDLIAALTPVKAEGYTDVKAAFVAAEALLKGTSTATFKTVVVFLTDGKPEIPQPYEGYESEALAIAKSMGVPVYAIALTREGQSAFLSQVASGTGGKVIPAKSANDLLDSYLQILGDLKDRTLIGEGVVRAPSQTVLELNPALTPYVSKATFIVSKELSVQVRLIGPDGREVQPTASAVTFSMVSDPEFAAYTISDPAAGAWRFVLEGSGKAQVRGILHSRLRARIISLPALVETGQPLRIVVNLLEEQADGSVVKIVGDATFSALVTLPDGSRQSLDTFYDDGTHGDQVAGDGNFTREFVDATQPGTYSVSVRGLKGMIPVSTAARVEAIPLPSIAVVSPFNQKYDIRTNTVPLTIRLGDSVLPAAFEGAFIANVTPPSGRTSSLKLESRDVAFVGEFAPVESGTHIVVFRADNAYYEGIPYQKEATAAFEAVMFAQLAVRSVTLGLGDTSGRDRFTVREAVQGVPVVVTVASYSTKSEQIVPRLENLPGFSLAESAPISVAPGGETTVTLHIVGDAQLRPGKWDGLLVFAAEGAVDIANARVPVRLEVFTPRITFEAEVISECSAEACWRWAPVILVLKTSSTSLVSEKVEVRLDRMTGATASPGSVEVRPGQSEARVEIKPGRRFAPGAYDGSVSLSASSEGVEVLPVQPLSLAYTVDPWWVSCRKLLILLGAGALAVLLIVAAVIRRIRRSSQPPLVTGTLIYWPSSSPEQTVDVDLTAMKKTEIHMGRGQSNEVTILDETVDEIHAVIVAERAEDEIRLMLHPRSKVTKGYRTCSDPLPLEENTTYQMGNTKFKFIPDASL